MTNDMLLRHGLNGCHSAAIMTCHWVMPSFFAIVVKIIHIGPYRRIIVSSRKAIFYENQHDSKT